MFRASRVYLSFMPSRSYWRQGIEARNLLAAVWLREFADFGEPAQVRERAITGPWTGIAAWLSLSSFHCTGMAM